MSEKVKIIMRFSYKITCAILSTIIMLVLTLTYKEIGSDGIPSWAYSIIMIFGFSALGVVGATDIINKIAPIKNKDKDTK